MIVPTLFVIFEHLQERIKPIVFEDEENPEVARELQPFKRKQLEYNMDE